MEYEIIKKDGSYRIMYKKGHNKVLSNHSFKTEDEAVNFVFSTEHSSSVNVTITQSYGNGNKVNIKKEQVKKTIFIPYGEFGDAWGGISNRRNNADYWIEKGYDVDGWYYGKKVEI